MPSHLSLSASEFVSSKDSLKWIFLFCTKSEHKTTESHEVSKQKRFQTKILNILRISSWKFHSFSSLSTKSRCWIGIHKVWLLWYRLHSVWVWKWAKSFEMNPIDVTQTVFKCDFSFKRKILFIHFSWHSWVTPDESRNSSMNF